MSAEPVPLTLPVSEDPLEASHAPQKGTGLCLSGGGYRAMLFHTGVIWRLGELGILQKLDRISSVSGGSIVAALLGLQWNKGFALADWKRVRFEHFIVDPI